MTGTKQAQVRPRRPVGDPGICHCAYRLADSDRQVSALVRAMAEAGCGEPPPPDDMRAAWQDAARAWGAADEPYPLATALLRCAESAYRLHLLHSLDPG